MTGTSDLVGPLPVIRFQDGTVTAYSVPRDTMDNRYAACTEHHPACDCREAEQAEELSDLRAEYRSIRDAFSRLLTGHAVNGFGERPPCRCSGCEIARAAHIFVPTQAMTLIGGATSEDWR